MRLAAVMGLVIEEMRERRGQPLRNGAHVGHGRIGEAAGQHGVGHVVDPVDDAAVLCFARNGQHAQIIMQDGVEPLGRLALACEAPHPDAVGRQDMVERAVHRTEERAQVQPVVIVVKIGRRRIKPLIGPAIIGSEHAEMLSHHLGPVPDCYSP